MSIKNFQIAFYCFLLVTQSSFGTFPITRTISQKGLSQYDQLMHEKLKKVVHASSGKEYKEGHYYGTNYFACAFSFTIEKKLSNIEANEKEVSLPNFRTSQRICKIEVTKTLIKLSKFDDSFLSLIGAEKDGFFVFKSDKGSSKTSKAAYANIITLQRAFYVATQDKALAIRLLAADFFTMNVRMQLNQKSIEVKIEKQQNVKKKHKLKVTMGVPKSLMNPNYNLINTDSEAHALLVLQKRTFTNAVCDDLKLDSDEYVTAIEFHGCTTQDMCPLCYANMNILQYLALNHNSESFLERLREKLIETKKVSSNCTVTTVISSLQEYYPKDSQNREYDPKHNTLWKLSKKGFQPNWVNQFRFDDNSNKIEKNDKVSNKENSLNKKNEN